MSDRKFTDRQTLIMKNAISFFGRERQTHKAIEELCELSVALSHYNFCDLSTTLLQSNKNNMEDVLNEIADVEIMIEQLKFMFGGRGRIERIINEKINRLENMINIERNVNES